MFCRPVHTYLVTLEVIWSSGIIIEMNISSLLSYFLFSFSFESQMLCVIHMVFCVLIWNLAIYRIQVYITTHNFLWKHQMLILKLWYVFMLLSMTSWGEISLECLLFCLHKPVLIIISSWFFYKNDVLFIKCYFLMTLFLKLLIHPSYWVFTRNWRSLCLGWLLDC